MQTPASTPTPATERAEPDPRVAAQGEGRRPPASIVLPTRGRPEYLRTTLASVAPQAAQLGCELLVIDDSREGSAIAVASEAGVACIAHRRELGANAARNTGIERSGGELVVLIDDDVSACEGWLSAFLAGAEAHPKIDVFAGAIVAHLEGRPPRSCGREGPPITSLELGEEDGRVRFAWSANMAVRRSAFERIGLFDASIHGQGEEQEWQERLEAAGRGGAQEGQERHEQAGRGGAQEEQERHEQAGRGGAQEEQERHEQAGRGGALYLARARVLHRRTRADSTLAALSRTAYRRGVEARRFDARRLDARREAERGVTGEPAGVAGGPPSVAGEPPGVVAGGLPSVAGELTTLAGCGGHVLRHRCPNGLILVAHSAGRVREALAESARRRADVAAAPAAPQTEAEPLDDFLSGESGTVGGLSGVRSELQDRAQDARELLSGQRARLARAAARGPRRRVLALGVVRERHRALADAIVAELESSHHEVVVQTCGPGERGKFENLRALLEEHPAAGHDWLVIFDDDIELGAHFLDELVFLAERFRFDLAQPAHRRASHAAWEVTRRVRGSVARRTRFVEIGPLTAFSRRTFDELLPFPPLRMGWGLEAHWAAIAQQRGWRCGVLDAIALSHRAAPAAEAYSRAQAIEEARSFLAERPYLPARETNVTVATHRRW
ncbi:MAG: glycosyltransferase [Solirubrobacteraceae bacterium]